jgi:hypothetical protein
VNRDWQGGNGRLASTTRGLFLRPSRDHHQPATRTTTNAIGASDVRRGRHWAGPNLCRRLWRYDRCKLVGGDFFTDVPGGGDAYLLAGVLHDWSDERATEILGRCREAIAGRGTLPVIDLVIPPGGEPSLGKWLDLHMLAMSGGRGRTEAEFATLLRKARSKSLTSSRPRQGRA